MRETRVRVRRLRPTALTWSIALAVTMLAVYTLTWTAAGPRGMRQATAGPRVTEPLSLEGMEGWCVTLGAYPDAARARVEASALTDRGSAGRVYEAEGAWRVLGAMYASERQAMSVARSMTERGGVEAAVLKLSVRPVALRVTAPRERIALIVTADRLLTEQAAQLGEMASRLDGGALQPGALRTMCALKSTEAGKLAEQLAPAGEAEDGGLEGALAGAVAALARSLEGIADMPDNPTAALSGAVRLCGIDTFLSLAALREQLLNGSCSFFRSHEILSFGKNRHNETGFMQKTANDGRIL